MFDAHDEATVLHLADMASAAIQHVETRTELERTLARLDLALDATGTGTWEWDRTSGAVRWSAGLHHIYGIEPGSFAGTVDDWLARVHPADREAALANLTDGVEHGRRIDSSYRIVWPDGTIRWLGGAGIPLLDTTGEVVGMTGVCADVTVRHEADEQRDREHRLVEQLHRVAATVTSSVDLAEILQAVTDAATALTPAQVGAFSYDATGDDGERYPLHTSSSVAAPAFDRFPLLGRAGVAGPAFPGTATVLLVDATTDPRVADDPSPDPVAEGCVPVRSYLAVPVLTPEGEVLGGMCFGHEEPGRFSELDVRLVEGIAGYASIAIRNARLFATVRRELAARERAFADRARVAKVLQESLLPPTLPKIRGLEVAARYRAGVDEVGGDFYDVSPLGAGRWAFVLGDVCGKGPRAAAQTAFARHTVRTAAMLESRERVLGVLNDSLWALGDAPERMCSVVFAVAETPTDDQPEGTPVRVALSLAGHPSPLVLRDDGRVEVVRAPGTLVGVMADPSFGEATVVLDAGDALVLYTDGVTEARRGSHLFDEAGLVALLAGLAGAPAERTADAIDEAVVTFRDPRAADDVAFLVLRVPG
jgi:GAF domain-containing protein